MQTIVLPFDGKTTIYNPLEAAQIIIDKFKESGKQYIGRGERKREYYNEFLTFDIETSKLENAYYIKGMPEKYRYFNVTYLWSAYVDGISVIGRDIQEFFGMLKIIRDALDGYIICYIHNLAYELFNNLDYFMQFDYEDAFFKNSSTPLYFRSRGYEFRCSAQLTHKKLARLGDEVHYRKLAEHFDYSRLLLPDSELTIMDINYSYRDTRILYMYIKQEASAYCDSKGKQFNTAHLPLTQTGYVRNDVKELFSYTAQGQRILENTALTQDDYYFVRVALQGGYTHANFRAIGVEYLASAGDKLLHIDLTSAYPWAMCTKRFLQKLTKVEEHTTDHQLREWLGRKNFGFIADITLSGVMLKKGRVPYIPYSEISKKRLAAGAVEENGKLVLADALRCTVCDTDLRIILDFYDVESIEVHEVYTGVKKPLPYSIVAIIVSYFCAKTELKGIADLEYEYMLAKQKLNGIFGLSCTALEHYIFEVDETTLDVNHSEYAEYKEAQVLPFQLAIQITAYVREAIMKAIAYMVTTDGCAYWYSDTDSIFCKDTAEARAYVENWNAERRAELEKLSLLYLDILPQNKKGVTQYLGTFSLEDEDATSFCTIGSKRYYIGYSDGTYEVTFSGLSGTKRSKRRYFTKKRKGYIIREKRVINGRNVQRLINMYGDLHTAFLAIKNGSVYLPYQQGDKLANYNVRAPFYAVVNGKEYRRPCTYTLYEQGVNLSLNASLSAFLADYDLTMFE